MTVNALYRELSEKLCAVTDENENEARIILEEVLSLPYTDFLLSGEKTVDEAEQKRVSGILEDRLSGRPIQYILGKWDFFSNEFLVGEGVLIPRPETEQLCEYAIEKLKKMKNPVVYDLCAGSGCIGLTVKMNVPDSRVFLFEKSPDALFYLEKNRRKFGLERETVTIMGDILKGYEAFSALPVPDVILSNPPYICTQDLETLQPEVKFEPSMALDAGKDGLIFYRAIAEKWLSKMKSGFAVVECGEEQALKIGSIFSGYCTETEIIKDFNHIDRFVAAFH
ncbi:MAG: peptide chain release factor N(5)-glutamine methyltransferase [Acutalibacteraceae bacterium]